MSTTPDVAPRSIDGPRESAGTDGVLGLRGFFSPRRVALLGASESSGWTGLVLAGADLSPGIERLVLVNPRRTTVHGRPAVPSLAALDEPVDLAFVMVGPDRAADVVEEAIAYGVKDFVMLSAGLGEAGEEGGRRQRRLAELCAAGGARLLGPNVSGYVNAAAGVRLFGLPVPADLPAGRVGVVMQSGGLATHVLSLARSWGVGLSLLATTGNEAQITATDVLAHLVDDEGTDAIAVFLESVRDPEAFRTVALRAAERGKPIVALHVGSSDLGRAAAMSHTGALVGDHAATIAALEDLGVVPVRSMEELVATAALLAHRPTGLPGRRLAVVAASGGACELIADASEALGFTMPPYAGPLADALAREVPEFADVRNPLDVTGFVVKAADLPFTATRLVNEHGADDYDVMILQSVVLPAAPGPDADAVRARFRRLADTVATSPVPVMLQTGAVFSLSPFALELVRENDLTILPGIATGIAAIDGAVRYAENRVRALRDRTLGDLSGVPPVAAGNGGFQGAAAGVHGDRASAAAAPVGGDRPDRAVASNENTDRAAAVSDTNGDRPDVRAMSEGRNERPQAAVASGNGGRPGAGPAGGDRPDAAALAALMTRCGVPAPPVRRVRSAGEAASAAAELGFPVVLKIAGDVAHKTDVGGVVLGLHDAEAVADAYDAMLAEVARNLPGARLDGADVAPMRPAGAELLVSVVRDPRWGPMLTVGAGGVLTELLADVAVRPLPVPETEIPGMLARLRAFRLLTGYRGAPKADLERVAAAIAGVQRLAVALGPRLRAVEVNPLWVRGDRVEALDLLVDWAE